MNKPRRSDSILTHRLISNISILQCSPVQTNTVLVRSLFNQHSTSPLACARF